MGLGKTVQAIALVARDRELGPGGEEELGRKVGSGDGKAYVFYFFFFFLGLSLYLQSCIHSLSHSLSPT